jgi:hypothetical protein
MMTQAIEAFTADDLKQKIDALGASTIIQVLQVSKGAYLVIYT